MHRTTTSTSAYVDTGDFARDAADVRRELSRLPNPIRRIIGRIRLSYIQRQLLDVINREVEGLAHADRAYVSVPSDVGPTRQILPADRYHEYLDKLLRRSGFLNCLRNEAQRILGAENVQKQAFPEKGLQLVERIPAEESLVVIGSTRFNRIEAVFETMNVGLAASIGNWILQHSKCNLVDDIGLEEPERPVSVLAWYSGIAGLLALVLDFQKPDDRRFVLTEVDVFRDLRDRQDSAWWTGSHGVDPLDDVKVSPVVTRVYEIPNQRFDFVVLDMPPPGVDGGTRLRNTWKTQTERNLKDPGRLAPRAWRRQLRGYIRRLPGLLVGGGQAILVLPMGVRVARGYRGEEDLLSGIEDSLACAGLDILRDVLVVEERPVAQPFVGTSRPVRRLLVVQPRVP